jgi:multidrug efflux pump subunit AcrA (membrane-fusion protein)
VGQAVNVTGIAFPNYVLRGKIKRVDRQGESAGNGLSTFSVQIVVSKLTPQQKNDIHVGMSAKVEINIKQDKQIMVPMAAVTEKNGMSYITIYNEKTKKTHAVKVKTGQTTADSVVILSNVKIGDKIVISN